MVLQIPLPHTKRGPYSASFWTGFEKDLTFLQKHPSIERLEEIILKNANMNPDCTYRQLPNLKHVLKNDDDDPNVGRLIAFIAELALSSPHLFVEGPYLFVEGHLPCLEKQLPDLKQQLPKMQVGKERIVLFKRNVKLTRLQVASLLSLMFFCAIFPWKKRRDSHKGHFTGVKAPTGKKPNQKMRTIFFDWTFVL